ncbi:hypothetical protein LOZ05_006620, partial [Ophidiomyces ophidiicola]
MAYNRVPNPVRDDEPSALTMDPNSLHPRGRASPARPLQSYQLEDGPYQQYGHLQMPSTDRLMVQPTYSVENMQHSFGHNEAYEQNHPYRPSPGPPRDYTLSPESHHDSYFNPPYQPTASPVDDYDLTNYPQRYHDDEVPILQSDAAPYSDGPPPIMPTPSPAPIRRWKTVKE